MLTTTSMRVAIVHYWLVNMRGGEKVVEAMCEMFPRADIYTHVYDGNQMPDTIKKHRIFLSRISKLPFPQKFYKYYLTFMPEALQELDLSGYDLVISSESGPAKGVILPSNIPHICYCHTPMRYLWDQYHDYLEQLKGFGRYYFQKNAIKLRLWDLSSANSVDTFVSNSHNVARRIKRIYRRESEVIYPPVEIEHFETTRKKDDYYLFLGQLVGYKRADLAIEACLRLKRKLVIAGGGSHDMKHLPSNITVLGNVSDKQKIELLANARALLFPGEEDFGIVPVEAMASGTPIIAYGRGGALETVKEGLNGVFFYEQTVESLVGAMHKFEEKEALFDGRLMRMEAMKFDKSVFTRKMGSLIRQVMSHMTSASVRNS